MKAESNVARVMIALERYRKAHGRWPDTLRPLVPAFLSELPQDYEADGPIRFARRNGALVVYSIGHDHTDDGGKLDKSQGIDTPKGTDWGLRLWEVRHRRWPPTHDLPENVFQTLTPEEELDLLIEPSNEMPEEDEPGPESALSPRERAAAEWPGERKLLP